MYKTIDDTFMVSIMVLIALFHAVVTLATLPKRGIFKDPRQVLQTKTNKELRSMLKGTKRISNLNKKQLINLVLSNT